MSARISFRLPASVVAAIEARDDCPPPAEKGRTGGASLWVRRLVLEELGIEAPADRHEEQAKRFAEGAKMRRYFADIEEASKDLKLPAGLTHMVTGQGGGSSSFVRAGFPSLEQAKSFAKDWLNPKKHERMKPPGGVVNVIPRHDIYGGRELSLGGEDGEYVLTYPDREPAKSY